MSSRCWKRLVKRLTAKDNRRRASRDSDGATSCLDDKDHWRLQESVYLFVLALERWLELALSFAYEDVEPEERGADEGEEGAQQE